MLMEGCYLWKEMRKGLLVHRKEARNENRDVSMSEILWHVGVELKILD